MICITPRIVFSGKLLLRSTLMTVLPKPCPYSMFSVLGKNPPPFNYASWLEMQESFWIDPISSPHMPSHKHFTLKISKPHTSLLCLCHPDLVFPHPLSGLLQSPFSKLELPISQTWFTCPCSCSLPTSSAYCNEADLLKSHIWSLPPFLASTLQKLCKHTSTYPQDSYRKKEKLYPCLRGFAGSGPTYFYNLIRSKSLHSILLDFVSVFYFICSLVIKGFGTRCSLCQQ